MFFKCLSLFSKKSHLDSKALFIEKLESIVWKFDVRLVSVQADTGISEMGIFGPESGSGLSFLPLDLVLSYTNEKYYVLIRIKQQQTGTR